MSNLKSDFQAAKRELSKAHAGQGWSFLWTPTRFAADMTYAMFCRGWRLSPALDHMIENWATRAKFATGGAV